MFSTLRSESNFFFKTIRTNKKISPFGKGTARWMFCICLCRNYLLWTFAATILWKTQPWDIFAWLPTAKCIASSHHDVSLKDDYSVPFFDLNFFYPHITSHVFFAKSIKHLRRKGLLKLEKYSFLWFIKRVFYFWWEENTSEFFQKTC